MNIVLNLLAKFLARPAVVEWLIRRAKRTPYVHITGSDGSVYMERYWLFNPYPHGSSGEGNRFPISIRLHRIMRPDGDQHLHDHPWNARTFILRGHYYELRPLYHSDPDMAQFHNLQTTIVRTAGDTAPLKFGEYHRITKVSIGGVWTLFVTGKKRGTWGFDVDGVKKPWREYLGIEE